MVAHDAAIDPASVLHRQAYRVFAHLAGERLVALAGEFLSPATVPALRTVLAWAGAAGEE